MPRKVRLFPCSFSRFEVSRNVAKGFHRIGDDHVVILIYRAIEVNGVKPNNTGERHLFVRRLGGPTVEAACHFHRECDYIVSKGGRRTVRRFVGEGQRIATGPCVYSILPGCRQHGSHVHVRLLSSLFRHGGANRGLYHANEVGFRFPFFLNGSVSYVSVRWCDKRDARKEGQQGREQL